MDFAATDAFQIVSMAIQTNSIEWNRMRVRAAFKVEFVWKIHWQLCRQNAALSPFAFATPMLIFFLFFFFFPFHYRHQENTRILLFPSSLLVGNNIAKVIELNSYLFYILQNLSYLEKGRDEKKRGGEYNMFVKFIS